MTVHTGAVVVAGVMIWVTAAACDKSSPRTPTAPSAPSQVVPTTLRIDGPASVALGETAQFKAILSQSDGSTRDVTSEASWRSSNQAVLQITGAGIATGIADGVTYVSSSFDGHGSHEEVLVLPRGTYRLAGRVVESGLPIDGAAVSVIAGQTAGLSATTDYDGRYALYGVAGNIEVRASKEGYLSHAQGVLVTANQALDFELAAVQRADVSGNYLLRITASECMSHGSPGVLPDEAKDRVYRASVTQDGPRLSVTLSGANLFGTSRFDGRVSPDAVSFTLAGPADPYYYYHPRTFDLGERLSGSLFLITSGGVTAKSTTAGITGVLAGLLRVAEGPNPAQGTRIADCWSKEHKFVMTK